MLYPVVRLAVEAPVPDRGIQRDRITIKNYSPIGGRKRGHDLVAAATTTFVDGRCKRNGNIDRSILELVGNVLDKHVLHLHVT